MYINFTVLTKLCGKIKIRVVFLLDFKKLLAMKIQKNESKERELYEKKIGTVFRFYNIWCW